MIPSPENFCKIDSEMVQPGAYFTLKLPDQANSLICPDANTNSIGSLVIELNCPGPVPR